MNDMRIFFKIRIKNTGKLAAIGNFFLAPTRWLFSGHSVAVMEDGITDVPSFSYGKTFKARRDSTLQSTNTDIGYAQPIVYWLGFSLAVIPGLILGSIFKGLSYIKNPIVQKTHTFVKEMLIPKNKTIEVSQGQKANTKTIREHLQYYSMTGQYTNALIISNEDKETKENVILDDKCVEEIVRHIRPSKLILNGVQATEDQFPYPSWEIRALNFFTNASKNTGDYSGRGSNNVTFFPAPKNNIPGVHSSVKEALEYPNYMPHQICVVRK